MGKEFQAEIKQQKSMAQQINWNNRNKIEENKSRVGSIWSA
jgi:hypothetical protein